VERLSWAGGNLGGLTGGRSQWPGGGLGLLLG